MYKLIKVSTPEWEEEREYIIEIFNLLNLCVCGNCKITSFAEMKKSFEDNILIDSFTDEDVQTELICCVSKEYHRMSTKGKVNELLSTACGLEFVLEGGN